MSHRTHAFSKAEFHNLLLMRIGQVGNPAQTENVTVKVVLMTVIRF